MIKIAILRYNNNLKQNSYDKLRSCLSSDYKEKFDRAKDFKDKQFVAMQYLMLKILLNKTEELKVQKNSFGKPFIKNEKAFSISHSGEYLSVCVADYENIGMDIQRISLYKEKVVQKICSENEKLQIVNSTDKDYAFTKLWTKKESYIKLMGGSIVQDLSRVDTANLEEKFLSMEFNDYILTVCK